ncbi:MAG: sigma-E factor negative regulatory protein [Pseudomonadota bacterium]
MSEQLRESLSAAIDNEADAFELRRVLDEASSDSDLREEWHRMHLIRDMLQDEMQHYRPGLREAVWQGLLADDPDSDTEQQSPRLALAAGTPRPRSPWLGRLTGVAVAAIAAVLVLVNGGVLEDDAGGLNVAGNESYIVGPENPVSGTSGELVPVMYQQATAADLHRQYGFMLRHIQHRGMNQNGLASFAKMATFSPSGQPVTRDEETPEQQ